MKLGASGSQEYLQAVFDTRGMQPPMIAVYTWGIPFTSQVVGIFAILKLGASSLLNEESDTRGIWPLNEEVDTKGIRLLEVDTRGIRPFK